MIDRGASINHKNAKGETAMDIAIEMKCNLWTVSIRLATKIYIQLIINCLILSIRQSWCHWIASRCWNEVATRWVGESANYFVWIAFKSRHVVEEVPIFKMISTFSLFLINTFGRTTEEEQSNENEFRSLSMLIQKVILASNQSKINTS